MNSLENDFAEALTTLKNEENLPVNKCIKDLIRIERNHLYSAGTPSGKAKKFRETIIRYSSEVVDKDDN
jgi:hypothetical protein